MVCVLVGNMAKRYIGNGDAGERNKDNGSLDYDA
jgi:hypothetical protein